MTPETSSKIARLRTSILRRFRTRSTNLSIADHELRMLHPANAEELIDEVEFDRDERLPYWADIWPSSRILAAHLLGLRGQGQTLLELGCGAGLLASCAALAGFKVTATDYYDDALRFTQINVWENAQAAIDTRLVDWRDFPDDLGRFDVVIASDVLYERPYGELVARAIARSLRRGGKAIVADPGRLAVSDFLTEARVAGLVSAKPEKLPFVDGTIRQTVTLYHLEHGWG
jgi:predicted nicotinamide N-methyase